jgi:hypothetical protein
MQPQVAMRVLSSTRRVAHTWPAGQAPPQVAPPVAGPPVLAHAVATAGRHVHALVGPGVTFAQQLDPAGQDPPQPGKLAPPHGRPAGSVVEVVDVEVVVDVGVSAATIAATSAST